ncbi:MAG TPA: histidine kinase [Thermoanaerobaculia bacterium]|jgi:two-component system LytT family sensor kinase|nr:histidine kinase [Thermoanaerobaculia bacterium]
MQAAVARVRVGTETALERRGAPASLAARPARNGPGSPGPRRSRAGAAVRILLVWTGVAFFIATQRYLRGPSLQPRLALPWGQSLAASLVTAYIWALLTPPAMFAARRWRPRRGAAIRNGLLLAAAGAAAAFAHLIATNLFWHAADPAGRGPDFLSTFLATLSFGGAARLATFFGIAGVTWGLDDFHTYREKELQASELERELVGTQLEALKLRLHPPFLFNTLATILPLIRTEPRAAARTVVQLGDILRLALHNDATGMVPLKTELEYIRLYLQIEQTRLRDRLEVVFAVEPEALDAAVPNLVLLPLCESAIANGASVRPGRARVEIRARLDGGSIRIDVSEAAADAGALPAPGPIDDSFVRKTTLRLELLYPGRHAIVLSDMLEKGHAVTLTLPYSPISDAALPAKGAA